jgi:DNA-binding NarL/FixJ family response regulator
LTAGAEASSIPAMATTRDARHMGLETPATAITPTESAVLNLLAQGLDNRQIAERLGKREKTVRNQVSAILRKLGVRTRAEAIAQVRKGRSG